MKLLLGCGLCVVAGALLTKAYEAYDKRKRRKR